MEQKETIRVRFAPSPTGHLHIGSLRAAIFNWLFARHYGGMFLLRIEDTDQQRSKKEYTESILDALKWCHIDYDGPALMQSDRIKEHKEVVARLIAEGKAYKCYCTAKEIEERNRSQAGYNDLYTGYDRFCADKKRENGALGSYVVRFKLPDDQKSITFNDLIRGPITFDRDQFDDFIIVRSDGTPMYNLAAVIDDNYMKITHVIRGEDHISNTPKQILLYEACGYQIPKFAHVPLILGPSGDKLSKRDAAVSVLEYKYQGYIADALFNYLVRLGWSHGDQEIFSRKELISLFTLDHVGKKGAIFDTDKLLWLNGVYMRDMRATDILAFITNDLGIDLKRTLSDWSEQDIIKLIDLYKERTKTLKELADVLVLLYALPSDYEVASVKRWVDQQTETYLVRLIALLKEQERFEHEQLAASIKHLCKEHSIKLVALAQPIRLSLTGTSASPGVFELLEILGKKESIKRIEAFLDFIQKRNI